MGERVAVLGASDDPARMSNVALHRLAAAGHTVLPVNPNSARFEGEPVARTLDELVPPVDTITVYLRPELAEPLADAMIAARPRRVIFNPGAESPRLKARLEAAGVRVQWDCTLVLLRTHRY